MGWDRPGHKTESHKKHQQLQIPTWGPLLQLPTLSRPPPLTHPQQTNQNRPRAKQKARERFVLIHFCRETEREQQQQRRSVESEEAHLLGGLLGLVLGDTATGAPDLLGAVLRLLDLLARGLLLVLPTREKENPRGNEKRTDGVRDFVFAPIKASRVRVVMPMRTNSMHPDPLQGGSVAVSLPPTCLRSNPIQAREYNHIARDEVHAGPGPFTTPSAQENKKQTSTKHRVKRVHSPVTHLKTGTCEPELRLELLHVLNAVVDEAEAGALAPTEVGPEPEQRHRRRVGHAELLLTELREMGGGG